MSVCVVAKKEELMKCLGFVEVDLFKEIANSSIKLNEQFRFSGGWFVQGNNNLTMQEDIKYTLNFYKKWVILECYRGGFMDTSHQNRICIAILLLQVCISLWWENTFSCFRSAFGGCFWKTIGKTYNHVKTNETVVKAKDTRDAQSRSKYHVLPSLLNSAGWITPAASSFPKSAHCHAWNNKLYWVFLKYGLRM